jgi:flagellar biosynthesis/type III secretory pathway M-ring protein FliF/YscJ
MLPVAAVISLFSGSAKKPLIIMALITAVLIALSVAYFYVKTEAYEQGYKIAEHKYLLEKEQAVTAAINEVNQKNKLNNEVAKTYWENKLAQKPKLETIEKEVIKYVQTNNDAVCMLIYNEMFIITELFNI